MVISNVFFAMPLINGMMMLEGKNKVNKFSEQAVFFDSLTQKIYAKCPNELDMILYM